jgi:hypothetical protein
LVQNRAVRREPLPLVASSAILVSIILAGCTAEFGMGMSEVAVPSQACIPASEVAVAAVVNNLDTSHGELVDAFLIRVPAADQGFASYPAFIFAARVVSLAEEPAVATWALSDDAAFRPIYPLDETAMLLSNRGHSDPESFMAGHLELISASASATTARNCAQAGSTAG